MCGPEIHINESKLKCFIPSSCDSLGLENVIGFGVKKSKCLGESVISDKS